MLQKLILLVISFAVVGCKPKSTPSPNQAIQSQKSLDPAIRSIAENALLQYQCTSAHVYENKTYYFLACRKLETTEYELSIVTRFFIIDRASKSLTPIRQNGIHEEAQEPPTKAIHMGLKDPEFTYLADVTQPLKPGFKIYQSSSTP